MLHRKAPTKGTERRQGPLASRRALSVPGRFVLIAVAAVFSSTTAYGADISAGKALAARCAVCHGADGIATAPDAPNLAGQNDLYLAKALRDFRSGARENEMMTLMAKGLSDADIENLAAYYHDIKIKVEGQ